VLESVAGAPCRVIGRLIALAQHITSDPPGQNVSPVALCDVDPSVFGVLLLRLKAEAFALSSLCDRRQRLERHIQVRESERLRPPQVVTRRPCEQGLLFASYRRKCVEVVID